MRLLFDMDGPLCRSRQRVDDGVAKMLQQLADSGVEMGLVTGSSLSHAKHQLGGVFDIMHSVWTNGGCSGVTDTAFLWACTTMMQAFSLWSGDVEGELAEGRSGAVYVAGCGVDASQSLRQEYADWARRSGERLRLAGLMERSLSGHYVTIGGSVSLDVYPENMGKHTIETYLGDVVFFCDSLGVHGGDTRLADRVVWNGGSVVYAPTPEVTCAALRRLYHGRVRG